MGYGLNALTFLIDTVVFLYTLLVVLRFLMQAVRSDYYNPVAQAIVTLTNPPLVRMRRIIPGFWGQDMAALTLALCLLFGKMLLLKLLGTHLITLGGHPVVLDNAGIINLLLLSVVDLAALVINLYLIIIIVQVIISWVAPGVYNPNAVLLYSLTQPILQPIQRRLPSAGGMDFSPMVASLALILLKMVAIPNLANLAAYL